METVTSFFQVELLTKSYGETTIFENVAFTVEKGQCLTLMGPSGQGKSTLLKCLAGLEEADRGKLVVRGTDLSREPTEKRKVVYLQQEALLFPHMNVEENIAFGLKARKLDKALIREKVEKWLELTGLQAHRHKRAHQLSGGQQQRVAIARALIIEPDVVLLDEPFHALDQMLKQKLYKEVQELFDSLNVTSILVTHDVREALIWGERFGWMENQQLKIYDSKAGFISDPQTGVKELTEFWKNIDHED